MLVCGLVVLGAASRLEAQAPPTYKVDPFWPKPLPNKWIMQQVPTLVVDKDDHIWVFKGNIYTGEVETGKRIQKFVPQ